MNKTIIINISGAIFHIEEDAYEILKNYMTEVKKHFGLSADSFEIVTDIENRIAELFSEILKRDLKQVIIIKDVQAIIEQMGRPADFEAADQADQAASPTEAQMTSGIQRKLFRDNDDKLIGGVCSGLAHYFSTDAVWIRLLWAALFFAGGIGLITYIILWIVMPVARTRAEKLAMNGEDVNLETIKNAVSDELNDVKKNLSKYRDQVKNSGIEDRIGIVLKEIFQFIGKVIQAFFKVFGLTFGVMAIFIGGCLMIGLVVAGIAGIFSPEHVFWFNLPFSMISHDNRLQAVISFTITFFIPLLFLILLGIRILFKRFIMSTQVTNTLLIIWFIALCFTGYLVGSTALQFNKEASFNQDIPIARSSSNSYFLKADKSGHTEDSLMTRSMQLSRSKWHIEFDDEQTEGAVNISIEKSDSLHAVLVERIAAKGINERQALRSADQIVYKFNQKDSMLNFAKKLYYKPELGYHEQQVDLTLKIPVNTVITIDQNLYVNNLPNLDNYKLNGPGNVWVMTQNGLIPKYGTPIKENTNEADKEENTDNDSTK